MPIRSFGWLWATSLRGNVTHRETNMPKARTPKKLPDQAEIDYRKTRSDERWERRVEYLMEFFSQPTCLLPRQVSSREQNSWNKRNRSSTAEVADGTRTDDDTSWSLLNTRGGSVSRVVG